MVVKGYVFPFRHQGRASFTNRARLVASDSPLIKARGKVFNRKIAEGLQDLVAQG